MISIEEPTQTLWTLGLDLGTNSLGYAAVRYSPQGVVEEILRAGSVIHNGGQDKDGKSFKAKAGTSRRSRNRYRQLRENRKAMDRLLRDYGFPYGPGIVEDAVIALDALDPFDVRADLADDQITDEPTRSLAVAAALRHMQSRRGQRNSWVSESFVKDEAKCGYSPSYEQLRDRCSSLSGRSFGELTPSQLISRTREECGEVSTKALAVDFLKDLKASESSKAKDSLEDRLAKRRAKLKNDKDRRAFDKQAKRLSTYLSRQSLRRSDFIRELNVIAEVQGLDREFIDAAASLIIFQEHPSKGVEGRVRQDELPLEGNKEPRALKSSLVFQEFRIASSVANLRHTDGSRLSEEERKSVREYLSTWDDTKKSPTWTDVANHIGVGRLKGHDDLSRPPINQTANTILKSKSALTDFWKDSSTKDSHRQALLDLITNERGLREDNPVDLIVQHWIQTLDEEDTLLFDTVKFEPGRASHSATTMRSLMEHMVNANCDEHTARKEVFGVPDGWTPAPNPLGTLIGNPTVDANIKLVKKVFDGLVAEIGSKPQRVVVESTRDITKSPSTRAQIHKDNLKRRSAKEKSIASALKEHSLSDMDVSTRAGELRVRILVSQNGACLYCGDSLSKGIMEIDHIIPRSRGGGSNRLNLAGVCRSCNHSKGNTSFVEWVGGKNSDTFEEVVSRVKTMTLEGSAASQKEWRDKYTSQLTSREADRPMESLSWAAIEVKNQLAGALGDPSKALLVSGKISSSARKMGKIDTHKHPILLRIPGAESKGKSRVDRRHHAVDAAVLTAISQRGITVLSEQGLLLDEALLNVRKTQDDIELPDVSWSEDGVETAGRWKDYTGRTAEDRASFSRMKHNLGILRDLLKDAVNNDVVPVTSPVRWTPRTGGIHEEEVRSLGRIPLGGAIPVSVIDRASSPQLWTALTRLPDFDPNSGLPENPNRTLRVKGEVLRASDHITFFPDGGGALSVRGGYSKAPGIHHVRVIITKDSKGRRKTHLVKVYQFDAALLHQKEKDVFSTPLPPSSLSMRDAGDTARDAFREGNWRVIMCGDELVFTTDYIKQSSIKSLKQMAEMFPDAKEYRYTVTGFSGSQTKIRPTLISEGDIPEPSETKERAGQKEENDDENHPSETSDGASLHQEDESEGESSVMGKIGLETKVSISQLEGVRVERRDLLGNTRDRGNVVLRSYVI